MDLRAVGWIAGAVARCIEELPKLIIKVVRRVREGAKCALCGQPCTCEKRKERRLRDTVELRRGRPVELRVINWQHYCRRCGK